MMMMIVEVIVMEMLGMGFSFECTILQCPPLLSDDELGPQAVIFKSEIK